MKKKLQKYLSGSNEGFSLVELIIVIAIMAILIGVVALAVIPYLEKSRESKDLQVLSTVSGALSTAIADAKATGTGTITIPDGSSLSTVTSANATEQKIIDSMLETIGNTAIDLSSSGGDGQNILCYYDTSTNTVAVYVAVSTQPTNFSGTAPTVNGTSVQVCRYNDNAPLMVTNGGTSAAAGAGAGSGS